MWIRIYRSLVTIRRALNVLIDYSRGRAYPGWKRGKKPEATVQELRDGGDA